MRVSVDGLNEIDGCINTAATLEKSSVFRHLHFAAGLCFHCALLEFGLIGSNLKQTGK